MIPIEKKVARARIEELKRIHAFREVDWIKKNTAATEAYNVLHDVEQEIKNLEIQLARAMKQRNGNEVFDDEIGFPKSIIDALTDASVVSFKHDEKRNTVIIEERCDCYFAVELNSLEFSKLIDELIELRTKQRQANLR